MTLAYEQHETIRGWSEQQLESLPHWGKVELVGGKVIMSPAHFDHGFVTGLLLSKLLTYVLEQRLGVVVDSSTGFRLANDDLLSPDVSFVAAGHLKGLPQPLRRFFSGAPDLAVEVLSPFDSRKAAIEKADLYFANGARCVWIVDAIRHEIEVRLADGSSQNINEQGVLSGGDVVPGFSLKAAEIFRPYLA